MAELTREIIEAEHYVARYARGTLSEQDAERFEEFCLLHPELVTDVHTDRAMRRALKAIGARNRTGGWRLKWQPVAIAASVLLAALVLGWQFWRSTSSVSALYAASTSLPAVLRERVAGPFAVVRQRGTGVQTLQIPPGAAALGLELELPEGATADRYQLALQELVDETWVSRGELEVDLAAANRAHVIPVVVDLRQVRGSRLRLTFSGPNGGTDAFELRLVQIR